MGNRPITVISTAWDNANRNALEQNRKDTKQGLDELAAKDTELQGSISTAQTTANNALSKANEAKTKADSVQDQLNDIVIESGNSSAEVVQMRTDESGTTFTTSKDRVDSLANKYNKTAEAVDDLGINVKKKFNVKGDGSDDTAAIDAAIDWAVSQNYRPKLIFPGGKYRYGGSKIVDGQKVCLEGRGRVTFDVTDSVAANKPYIFNLQNTKVDSGEMNWTQPAFKGFHFITTLDKATLLTKDTVLFAFETPHAYAAAGNNTKNSSNLHFENISGRWIPYYFTFGQSAFLLRFKNVNFRLCRTLIKVFHPTADPGVINKTQLSGRYHIDYGENISFEGGQMGGAWETAIYNKLQAGSLNFEDVSIDYWTGGTFLTVGHNGKTNFFKGHVESAHNPSVSMNPYNMDAPDIKHWIEMLGSHKVNFEGTTFYAGTVSDRDTTDMKKLVNGTANNTINFIGVSFENMKFTEKQLANFDNCNVIGCTFIDSIPFFKNLTTLNDNLVFNKKNDDITDVKTLENVFCPYYASAGFSNLTDQWTNSSIKVEWDSIEKAFKITKTAALVSQVVAFSFPVPNASGNNLIYTLDVKANGTTSGNFIVKLRGGEATKKHAIDNNALKSYYEYTDLQYIRDLVSSSAVPTAWTTYTLTSMNGFIPKQQRYKKYLIEIDINSLAVGESIFIKNVIAQVL